MVATEPLIGARIPDQSDGPLGGLQIANALKDAISYLNPRFANAAARDAAYSAWVAAGNTMQNGLGCVTVNDGRHWTYWNSGWRYLGGDVTIGDAHLALQTTINTDSATWKDLVTVAGTSSGRSCVARISETAHNANSGLDRTMDVRVICDGTETGSFGGILMPLANLQPISRFAAWSSTPSAGPHTWKLQARASTANAVVVQSALLTVVEK